jgi:hypothetical protein
VKTRLPRRRSPVGLSTVGLLNETKGSSADRAALNLLLQQLAWDAVRAHPLSGVR